jgi:hypothetical protein
LCAEKKKIAKSIVNEMRKRRVIEVSWIGGGVLSPSPSPFSCLCFFHLYACVWHSQLSRVRFEEEG